MLDLYGLLKCEMEYFYWEKKKVKYIQKIPYFEEKTKKSSLILYMVDKKHIWMNWSVTIQMKQTKIRGFLRPRE